MKKDIWYLVGGGDSITVPVIDKRVHKTSKVCRGKHINKLKQFAKEHNLTLIKSKRINMERTKTKKRREYKPTVLRRKVGEFYEGWTVGFVGFDGNFCFMKGPFRVEACALEMTGKTNYIIRHTHHDGSITYDWKWIKGRWVELLGDEKNQESPKRTAKKKQAEIGFRRTK